MTAFPGLQVVLTTYQSSPVIAAAARTAGFAFDFAVLDEAHKTTGKAAGAFAHLLYNANLPLPRRLFMTATERRFAGTSDDIVSMDDPAIYGETFSLLTFKAAITAEPAILCDYRILTIGVRQSDVATLVATNRWLDLGPAGPDEITALALASLIALRRATAAHGVRHTVSFHSSIARARYFQTLCNRLNAHLTTEPPILAHHVSGKLGSAVRQREIKQFLATAPSLITNARCLTEGVDMPRIDCVFFADPKGSTIEIVQAAGRALRLAPGKTRGYILLPLVVPDGATLDEVTATSAFKFVLFVLRALAAHDECIIEWFRATAEARTREVGGFVSFDCRSVTPLGVSVEEFAKQIEIRCWESMARLGHGNWDFQFAELEAYKKEFGNVNVPKTYLTNPALANWVATQRALCRAGELRADKISKLEALGFEFGASHEASWGDMFEALRDFHAQNGHCKVPTNYHGNRSLGIWVGSQRQAGKKLTPDRIKLLNSLGFTWDLFGDLWSGKVAKLESFKAQHGHCRVPQVYPSDPKLGRWVIHQRSAKATLSVGKIKQLDALGFDWDPATSQLEAMFTALRMFKDSNGHCDVPPDYAPNPALGTWLRLQRGKYRNGKMARELIQRFEALGMVWRPQPNRRAELNAKNKESKWAKIHAKIKEFKVQSGHCNVPMGYPEKTALGMWASEQRVSFRQGTMDPKHHQLLDEIGFVWDVDAADWDNALSDLKKFKAQHGHCRVPQNYALNRNLKAWVSDQRDKYLNGKMPQDRIQKLEAVGLDWDPRSAGWETRFSELQIYRKKHGHSRVPARDLSHPQLGSWLAHQREVYRAGKMTAEKIKRLENLGVIWKRSAGA